MYTYKTLEMNTKKKSGVYVLLKNNMKKKSVHILSYCYQLILVISNCYLFVKKKFKIINLYIYRVQIMRFHIFPYKKKQFDL